MARTRNSSGTKPKKSTKAKQLEEVVSPKRMKIPSSPLDEKKYPPTPKHSSRPSSRQKESSKKTATQVTPKKKGILSISEDDIIKATDTKSLMTFINSLIGGQQDEIFEEYKKTNDVMITEHSELVESLYDKVESQQKTIDLLLEENRQLKGGATGNEDRSSKGPVFESPIRKNRSNDVELLNESQLAQELKTIGIILDMLELLTGLRIINYEEDKSKLYFDIKQIGTIDKGASLTINYRLIISKKFDTSGEVNYEPTFLQDEDNEETNEKLLSVLPEYFCDNLSFPYNTLCQFYTKMNKALNKINKK